MPGGRYMDIKIYCEYTYSFSFIPIYIYENRQLSAEYQGSAAPIKLPAMIEGQLLDNNEPISFFETSIGSYFGKIYLQSQATSVILGPVFPVEYQEDAIWNYFRQYGIEPPQQDEYRTFLLNIPSIPLFSFVKLLYQMSYALTEVSSDLPQEDRVPYRLAGIATEAQVTEHSRNNLETGYHNTLYETMKMTMPMVKNGDLEGLDRYSKNVIPMNFGSFSNNLREQQLVVFIISICYAMTAAIEGGVNQQAALSMTELYIRKGLRLASPAEIDALAMKAIVEFTKRVREEKYAGSSTVRTRIYDCIQYINERVYSKITVSEVAEMSGYSLEHFSRIFKRETGVTANHFITDCKLNEAKRLLKFTNMAIAEISSQLYFSNQSHFQKQFKSRFKMTPLEYRNLNVL